MKSFACCLLAAAAGLAAGCTDDSADRDVLPANDFGTASSSVVQGRVCVASDLRDMLTCSSSGAGGLTVAMGNDTTTTNADGTFSFNTPTTPVNSFTVTGTATGGLRVVPTSSPFSNSVIVPAIDADLFARMLSSNGIVLGDGTGSVLASVTRDGQPVQGISVTSSPQSAFGPFYDATSPVTWGTGGTATRGMVLVPGLTAGMVDLSFENALGGVESTISGIQVRNGGVTVLDSVLPGTIP
jgi:hypothetical protein